MIGAPSVRRCLLNGLGTPNSRKIASVEQRLVPSNGSTAMFTVIASLFAGRANFLTDIEHGRLVALA
jgi:hypothetical protein